MSQIHVYPATDIINHGGHKCACRPVKDKVCDNVIIHNRIMTKKLYDGKLYSKWTVMNVANHDLCSMTVLTRKRARMMRTSYYTKVVKVLMVIC